MSKEDLELLYFKLAFIEIVFNELKNINNYDKFYDYLIYLRDYFQNMSNYFILNEFDNIFLKIDNVCQNYNNYDKNTLIYKIDEIINLKNNFIYNLYNLING